MVDVIGKVYREIDLNEIGTEGTGKVKYIVDVFGERFELKAIQYGTVIPKEEVYASNVMRIMTMLKSNILGEVCNGDFIEFLDKECGANEHGYKSTLYVLKKIEEAKNEGCNS